MVVAVVLLMAGCGRSAGDGGSSFTPVATTKEIMDGIVVPDSQAVFDAILYENGTLTRVPKGDDEWNRLRLRALAVAEAGNLLQMPPRARDDGDWMTLSRAMTTKAAAVAKATESTDPDAVLLAGGELYDTCTACHGKYLPR
jgi:cytochrome c556